MTEQEIINFLKCNKTGEYIMSNSKSSKSSNDSDSFAMFINMLQVLFIGLKLTNNIDWSWWWVLSPIWIQFVLVFILIFFFIIGRRK